MGWGSRAGGAAAIVLVLTGGYLTLDAYDVVPGLLTVEPAPAPAAPFPDAPGAAEGPAPAEALGALSEDAPTPSADEVGDLVAGLAADERLGKRLGVLVLDQQTGDVLGAKSPSAAFVPASTQKLFTAAAALATLDPTSRLQTTVVQSQSSPGTIVLHGGGDMMLAAGKGKSSAINGHAGLGDLAEQVADKLTLTGTTSVRLVVDDTLFTGPAISPTWDTANIAAGYGAPVTALAVDIARLSDTEYAQRSTDPSMAAAETFAEQLAERGVTVTGDPTRGKAPSSATEIGSVSSAPLRDVVAYFLDHSDNTITEVVGRLVAIDAGSAGSAAAAPRAVRAAVGRLGVDTDGLVLADCSGLGEGSKASPAQLGQVLSSITSADLPRLRPAALGMPIAALTGTLSDRFVGTVAAGVTRAKTGSLPNTRALSGTVVTADGRMLVFAVLADRIADDSTYGAPFIIDDFVEELAACGCRG